MAENSEPVPTGKEGVDKMDLVWGSRVGNNYKSVSIDGEAFSLGDCVRCLLKSKPGHIGKIVKLFEKEGKAMCRIRSFFSPSELSPAVKGLDYTSGARELFLASGDGPGVEKDILLEKLAGRCFILCTAAESFNEMPSDEQIEAADYFFCRGYDPANEEVVGLDTVEDAIGAQKVYNKKEWLVPVDKIIGRPSVQIPAPRMHGPSSAPASASGSSSHQGAAKGTSPSISVASPAPPPRDSTQPKLKKRTNNPNLIVPEEPHKRKKNEELHILKSSERKKRSEYLVFAIPAPSKVSSSEKREVVSPFKRKPPPLSVFKSKGMQPKGEGESLKVSKSAATPPVGQAPSEQAGAKDGAGGSSEKKRRKENMPNGGAALKKIVKPVEKANASAEREKPSKLHKRVHDGVAIATSPTAEQKPQGPLFKRRVEDWDISSLVPAIQSNRVLLLNNLVPGLHSDDLSEALSQAMNFRCDVRIAPPVSASYRTTSALLKLPTANLARSVLQEMRSKHVSVANRLVTASAFKYNAFKAPSSKFFGHLEFPKEGRDYINEDYRDAVATSHFAQGNTIEFDYGLPWRVLDEQHEEQWKMLQAELNSRATLNT